MSKPIDVPQDVRDRAEVAFDAILRAGDPSLVIGIIECAIIAEREACAQVAENRDPHWADDADHIAKCIRNRSQT